MENRLLQAREVSKRNKPSFTRQDSHKVSSLGDSWRIPKGMHSKTRKKLRGYMRHPSIGWSSPKAVRGLTPEGYKQILVHNVSDLETVKDPIIIGAQVGVKKRMEIIKKAQEKNIKILNIKNVEQYVKEVQETQNKKKDLQKANILKKQKIEEDAKRIKDKKKEAKDLASAEEKEKQAKEEQRKVLEQK